VYQLFYYNGCSGIAHHRSYCLCVFSLSLFSARGHEKPNVCLDGMTGIFTVRVRVVFSQRQRDEKKIILNFSRLVGWWGLFLVLPLPLHSSQPTSTVQSTSTATTRRIRDVFLIIATNQVPRSPGVSDEAGGK